MASEKRLIDVNKAVALMNQIETDSPFDDKEDILEKCVNILGICPTVDAVEVVRCKDCKWRCNGKDCDHPLLLSWSWGAIRNVKDDDFCSYGERKDNEQT